MRLARKDPDWIFLSSQGSTLAVMLKDIKKLELKEQGIKFCTFMGSFDDMLPIVGKEVMEGMYHTAPAPYWTDADIDPELERVVETAMEKYGWEREEVYTVYLAGYEMGLGLFEAIRLAIANVGDPAKVTGKVLRDAFVTVKELALPALPPSYIDENHPWVIRYMRIGVMQEGKPMGATEWFEPLSFPTWKKS